MTAFQLYRYGAGGSSVVVVRILDRELRSLDVDRFGRLDQDLADRAATAGRARIILDISRVDYYGAAFLGMLVRLARKLAELGKQLVLCGDERGIVNLAGLNRLFPVFPGIVDALGA